MVLPIIATGQVKVTGVLVAVASPRRRLDDHYCDFLNQVAGQIALAIANAQAYEAERKRAEALAELDRAKTAFFSNVSHEFRTPLTLMLSPLEELSNTLDGQLQPDQREQLQLIQRNGLRLQKLVNTLLDFSRIEAGRVQAFYEPIDLATYTAELASVFRSLIERAGMSLIVDCPALPEPVYVDREMWEKIVLNLVSNAFKFTFTGSITVRLQPVGNSVELSVTDTGVGIPEAELPRLFERFHRVSGTRSRTYEGSGIGLSLVQELVKLHGGTIHVTSQVDCGTTFTIALPFGTTHLPQDRIEANRTLTSTALGANPYVVEASRWMSDAAIGSAESLDSALPIAVPTRSKQSSLPTARVLLADDNADMRDYVKRLLSQYWEVETVSDGLAALEAIAQHPPDLILSDVMMPRLDGFGLLSELRADPTTQNIPVILLSARAGEESRIEGLEAGADDYLIKPFSARELLARVESNLKLAQLRKAAAQQEQALRVEVQAARDRLDNVLTRIADQFLALDREWCYTYVNDRVIEVTGINRENLLGRSIWELFPDTVDSQLYTEVHRAVAEQTPVQFEYFYPKWNRWFENHVYPSVDGVSIISTEITERKQAEIALQQREAELRLITNTVPVLISFVDLEQRYRFNSQKYEEWFGHPATEIYGKPIWEVLGEAAYEAIRPYVEQVLAGEQVTFESQIPYQDRGTRYVYATYVPRFDSQGNVEGFVALISDITDRKQAEADLRESEARYRHLAEAIPQLVWMTDAAGQNEYVNQRFCDYTGLTAEQLRGSNWLSIIHPDDLAMTRNRWLAAINSGQFYEIEYRFCRADGSYRWFLGQGIPLRDEQGQIHQWFGTCTDIEPQKQLEQTRLRLLEQEQAAREQAENANRIKDEFLAVLSHELRSPLNPILGWSKLLRNGKLDATRTTYALETIERNAQLQVQLIDDLLDISRILRGKLALTVAPVDLSFVISAALETVRLAAEAKSLQIQTILSPIVGTVNGDAGRLQQVVWNLLSNAVKFTPEGGRIAIRLSLVTGHTAVPKQATSLVEDKSQRTNDQGQMTDYAQIQVKDTGKGISSDFLPYVFEHFRQEDGTTTRKFGGLGLGLAIARQIIEMHGGQIGVDSPGEGQGATFTVQLPLAPPSSQLPLPKPSSASSNDLSGIHILVVDDELDSRDFIAFVLEQAGAIVTSVASGIEGLTAIEQSIPNLIVSDVGMSDMDSYMLLQQIRALEAARQIPAIALTAYAGELDRQQALKAGFQRHLSKPIDSNELIKAISNLIAGSSHE